MSAESPTDNVTQVVLAPQGPGKASTADDTKIVKPIQYKLTSPLQYGDQSGEFRAAGYIMLYEPAGRNRDACTVLEQLFLRALRENKKLQSEVKVDPEEMKAALELLAVRRKEASQREHEGSAVTDAEDAGSEGFTGGEALTMIGSTSISMGEVVNNIRKLICDTGLARIDDVVNLTPTIADAMPWRELKGLVGAYLAGFIVPSALESTG